MTNSLWLHERHRTRLPCPSPPPGACSNSCPLSRWCHPPISSSDVPLSSGLQSFPASGSFPVSWLFSSGSQSTGASVSASVLQWIFSWFPLGLTGLISLQSKGLSTPQFKSINSLALSLPYGTTLTSVMTTGKTIALTIQTFVSKVMSLSFNMLPRFVIGEGNGNPLQYYYLENPMGGGAW